MDAVKVVDKVLTKVLAPLKDEIVAVPLALFLLVNAGLLSDSPPESVRVLMRHPIVRLVILFIVCVLLAKGVNTLAYMLTAASILLFVAVQRMDMIESATVAIVRRVQSIVQPVVKPVIDTAEQIVSPIVTPVLGAGKALVSDALDGAHDVASYLSM